jgi:putative ABC transport system permease protein
MQPSGGNAVGVGKAPNFLTMGRGEVGVGFFELHGLRPVAGRFFSKDHGEDLLLDRPNASLDLQPSIILNEAGARRLGFARPADAIGKSILWMRPSPALPPNSFPTPRASQVIGVAPDYTLGSIRSAIPPMLFWVDPAQLPLLTLKLDRDRIPEALQDLARLWRATGQQGPPDFTFETRSVQDLYKDVITQEIAIGICAGLAILIACLGLFALAAFTTERRIKEIGVRKAMGASTFDVVKLLLWQFTKPVLWANLIAWPLAFWAMDHWLHGFAYRVDLPAWLFLIAAVAAVLIAWATVSIHAWMAAKARPATALRYE